MSETSGEGVLSMTETQTSERGRLRDEIVCAVVGAVVLEAMTIARNNYGSWDFRVTAAEVVVGLVALLLARAIPADERAASWLASWTLPQDSLAMRLLRRVPVATARAVVMAALLSVLNVCVVPAAFFYETVDSLVVRTIVRFLADVPACWAICLLVPIATECLAARRARRNSQPA